MKEYIYPDCEIRNILICPICTSFSDVFTEKFEEDDEETI